MTICFNRFQLRNNKIWKKTFYQGTTCNNLCKTLLFINKMQDVYGPKVIGQIKASKESQLLMRRWLAASYDMIVGRRKYDSKLLQVELKRYK